MEKALFGAGCFWGVEEFFRQVPGVRDAVSGYAGGQTGNPTYSQVCGGDTFHAEVVEVTFDPAIVSYETLVDLFFRMRQPGSGAPGRGCCCWPEPGRSRSVMPGSAVGCCWRRCWPRDWGRRGPGARGSLPE